MLINNNNNNNNNNYYNIPFNNEFYAYKST